MPPQLRKSVKNKITTNFGAGASERDRFEEQPNSDEQASAASKRMRLLNDITLQIDLASGKEEILGVIRQESNWILKYDVCLVGLINLARTHYVLSTLSTIADSTNLNHIPVSLDEGMMGWVIKNHSPIIVEVDSGPSYSHAVEGCLKELGIKTLLIVPMRIGMETIGSLAYGSTQQGIYRDEDLSLTQLFATHLASAIKHTSLLDDVQKRIAQIELINEVGRQLTSKLVLDEVLEVAASAIQKSFNYFDVTIFLVSPDKTELLLEAHSGSFVDFLPHGYRQGIDQGIIGWVARNGEKILLNDVSSDARYMVYAYHQTRSELAVPIKIDGQVVGVLNVEDTKLHAFDDTDAVVLETLTDQLGGAIKNAKLYDEVRQTNMKLTELDKMKSEFLGIVSHDFRSPLSSIVLAGKSLLRNETVRNDQHIREYIQLIVDQAARLNQLAEDTLSITKIESGQLNYYFKIVNVERLIQDAISLVRFSSRHTLDYKIDQEAVFIKGDQAKLRQVIQNILSNAVKYSPRGGKVSVLVEDYSSEEILVSVTDEGIGIAPEQMGKLFQKFSRVDIGEARDIKGSGLGLWICREIVQAHGGHIWVESEPGCSTTFKFTLKKAH